MHAHLTSEAQPCHGPPTTPAQAHTHTHTRTPPPPSHAVADEHNPSRTPLAASSPLPPPALCSPSPRLCSCAVCNGIPCMYSLASTSPAAGAYVPPWRHSAVGGPTARRVMAGVEAAPSRRRATPPLLRRRLLPHHARHNCQPPWRSTPLPAPPPRPAPRLRPNRADSLPCLVAKSLVAS